jgi:hypothetical protein
VHSPSSDISDAESRLGQKLALDAQVPLFAVRCLGMRILGKNRQPRRQIAGGRRRGVNEAIGSEIERSAIAGRCTVYLGVVKRPVIDRWRIV